jgi:hypothetical protein
MILPKHEKGWYMVIKYDKMLSKKIKCESKKEIMKNLLNVIADLVEMLVEYGADIDSIIASLKYHGFTDDEIAEYYGLNKGK